MKKILSAVLAALSTALLVLGIALPTYLVPKGRVLPLDVVSTTGTAPTASNLLDSGALAAGKPVGGKENLAECRGEKKQISCFMWKGLELESQRFTTAQEPSDAKQVTLEVGQALLRTDKEEPKNLVSATVDRVTLDRKTQLPVPDPVSTLNVTPPLPADSNGEKKTASTAPFVRDGVQYQFPMGAEKKSYPYFDINVLRSKNIDFVGEEKQGGVKVFRYEQTVEPTEIYPRLREALEADGKLDKADQGSLASLRLAFPASVWGVEPTEEDKQKAIEAEKKAKKEAKVAEGEKPAEGEAAAGDPVEESETVKDPKIEMSRFYTINRTIWIEPRTGVIVNGSEEIWQYYARDEKEAKEIASEGNREKEIANPTRTALYYPASWNDESKENQLAKARQGFEKVTKLSKTMPLILIPVGILLLVSSLFLARGSRND